VLPPANPKTMAAEIRKRMKDNAFGYQFAIAQNGKLVPGNDRNDRRAGGYARSAPDGPDGKAVAMKATMRYEVASFTKNPTAVATMKLLRMNDLSIESKILPWLPSSWKKRGSGWEEITFRHLLAHTSGVNQMLVEQMAKLGEEAFKKVFDNDWEGLEWTVQQHLTWTDQKPVKLGAAWAYKNANYGLLGILNAYLWKAKGGKLIQEQDGQIVTLPVQRTTHARYQQDFNQRHIFTPSGIKNVGCVGDSTSAGLNYPAGAKYYGRAKLGALLAWPSLICAGNAGLRLSSIEMVRYLAHLRHGTIIHPDDLETMDTQAPRLGWSKSSNTGDKLGVYWHDGAFNNEGAPQVWTCGMTYGDGTEAAIIVNSPLKSSKPSVCTILLDSWKAAK